MRHVTIKAPEGRGAAVAELAFRAGATEVSVQRVQTLRARQGPLFHDVVEVDTATPIARAFLDAVMEAPFYEPAKYRATVVHPRAVVASEGARDETRPIVMPHVEVYEELWQYSHVTRSFVIRVFVAALLLAYGMIEGMVPLMIAGLLFLPYHHQMLAIALGLFTREWRLAAQGVLALAVATALIAAGGACVALVTDAPLLFDEFGSPLSAFVLALAIGAAAALASADDAGRRELIGLAATAHITVLPAWFGIALVFGEIDRSTLAERLSSFAIAVTTLIAAATITYALLRLRREGALRLANTGPGRAAHAEP